MTKAITFLAAALCLMGAGLARGAEVAPSAETAEKQIKESPRHGEWVEIDLPGEAAKVHTWVVYYGAPVKETEGMKRIACPVAGFYGGDDARITATVEPTGKQMKELGKEYIPHVFDGAGHGFLRQQSGREGANQKAAEQAWPETVAFLRKNLQ